MGPAAAAIGDAGCRALRVRLRPAESTERDPHSPRSRSRSTGSSRFAGRSISSNAMRIRRVAGHRSQDRKRSVAAGLVIGGGRRCSPFSTAWWWSRPWTARWSRAVLLLHDGRRLRGAPDCHRRSARGSSPERLGDRGPGRRARRASAGAVTRRMRVVRFSGRVWSGRRAAAGQKAPGHAGRSHGAPPPALRWPMNREGHDE